MYYIPTKEEKKALLEILGRDDGDLDDDHLRSLKANISLTALQLSVVKWTLMEEGRLPLYRHKGDSCPLCVEQFSSCDKCPVSSDTGKKDCSGSPWLDFYNHQRNDHKEKMWVTMTTNDCPICKTIAKQEKEFLQRLEVKEHALCIFLDLSWRELEKIGYPVYADTEGLSQNEITIKLIDYKLDFLKKSHSSMVHILGDFWDRTPAPEDG